MTMDLLVQVILFTAAFVLYLWWLRQPATIRGRKNLPPGPPGWPIVGNLIQVFLRKRHFVFQIPDLRAKYGPIFTLKMGQRTIIIVTSPELIHEALVQKGPLFDSRPPNSPIRVLFNVRNCAIISAVYGPIWQTLRRNFVTELISPRRIKQCFWLRDLALEYLLHRLKNESDARGFVEVRSNVRLTASSILICLCFGAKLPEETMKEIEHMLEDVMLVLSPKLVDFMPVLQPLFYGQIKTAKKLRKKEMECLLPLLRSRRAFVESGGNPSATSLEMVSPVGSAYVDSLFSLDVPGLGLLQEEDFVTLCAELIIGGIDTTATTVEWVLFELVQHQEIQEKLYHEIIATVGENGTITEDAIENMPYLGAIVKESMRCHPTTYLLLSHAVLKETILGGYTIPADADVQFYTKWATEDPNIWEDPGDFRPERFLTGEGSGVDLMGKREIKLAPFGAGRRICPASTLGMLHVHLLIARLIHAYKWIPVPGFPPNPTASFAITVVMKDPLKAVIVPRS